METVDLDAVLPRYIEQAAYISLGVDVLENDAEIAVFEPSKWIQWGESLLAVHNMTNYFD